jgi:hypothetical protein
MLTTGMATLVTRDLLMRWNTQTQLQVDATRMAVAGAVYLPSAPARARLAAAHSAALCGLVPSEVVSAGTTSDRMSFHVTLRRSAPLLFLRLLGLSGVSATATATVHPYVPQSPVNGAMMRSVLGPAAARLFAAVSTETI